MSDTTPLTPDKITAETDVAALLIRGKAWSTNELAGALAGSSTMNAIAVQVSGWWSRREQAILFSILRGIFGSALATSHVNDISGGTGTAADIDLLKMFCMRLRFLPSALSGKKLENSWI